MTRPEGNLGGRVTVTDALPVGFAHWLVVVDKDSAPAANPVTLPARTTWLRIPGNHLQPNESENARKYGCPGIPNTVNRYEAPPTSGSSRGGGPELQRTGPQLCPKI
ncbi:MAG: hypothetical protein NXI31_05390 [bacterium]|nr:hypothetical protein [bacterium]